MRKGLLIFFMVFPLYDHAFSQSVKKRKNAKHCGWYVGSKQNLEKNFESTWRYLEVQPGEVVADVGAASGWVDALLAVKLDDVTFYIEDIDTTCLREMDSVVQHYTKLNGSPLSCSFTPVTGTFTNTNLPPGIFDRVMLINTFHELSHPKEMLADIHGLLKENGTLVVYEKMGKKPGIVRKDCGHKMPFEKDFLPQMNSYGFEFVKKQPTGPGGMLVFYYFKPKST